MFDTFWQTCFIFRQSILPVYCLTWSVFLLWRCDPTQVMASSLLRFLDHTQRRTTAARTPLEEWSTRRRDLYLTTHDTHNRKISMPPVGFEPTISAGERPQTYALDRAATGTGTHNRLLFLIFKIIRLPPHNISFSRSLALHNVFLWYPSWTMQHCVQRPCFLSFPQHVIHWESEL